MGYGGVRNSNGIEKEAGSDDGQKGIEQIEHIVVFMQENRAFDHYYGSMRGVRGFNDRAAPSFQMVIHLFSSRGRTSQRTLSCAGASLLVHWNGKWMVAPMT